MVKGTAQLKENPTVPLILRFDLDIRQSVGSPSFDAIPS